MQPEASSPDPRQTQDHPANQDSIIFRSLTEADLEQVAAIQSLCPQAAQWPVASYILYDSLIAIERGRVAGFLIVRQLSGDEYEILNLAVAPNFRRRGIARRLLERARLDQEQGVARRWYLEVRESNSPAISLYSSLGFEHAGLRQDYYNDPKESAIVMSWVS